MKKVNVLHLITGLPIGGAEKVLLDLCTHIDSEKINSYVIGLNHENDMNSEFEKSGIYVKNLDMRRDAISFLKTLKTLNKLLKEHHIDIIHTHMFHPLIFAYILKLRYSKLKIVFTSHSENIGSKAREKITKITKYFRDTDIVFSREMITDIYKADAKVIVNGVDIEKFKLNLEKNKLYTFIAVGVLRAGKNHIALVKYAKKLREKGYKFQIQIVGSGDASGDEQENIKTAIKKEGIRDIFLMLGKRADIPTLLNRADCFVMPSLYEGLPISILEAGATSLPIISTEVGVINTVIDDECGYLVSLDEFGEKMEYILNNKEEAKERGKKLFEKINNNYSIKNMAFMHKEIYLGYNYS